MSFTPVVDAGLASIPAQGPNGAPTAMEAESAVVQAAPRGLVVAPGGEWFHLEGRALVNLETRISLRKLLIALATLRVRNPEGELSVREAFNAGWPGERAHPDAAAVRVYTAIHTLRALGLRGILVRKTGGYVLDIDVRLAAPESQFPGAYYGEEDTIARAV